MVLGSAWLCQQRNGVCVLDGCVASFCYINAHILNITNEVLESVNLMDVKAIAKQQKVVGRPKRLLFTDTTRTA
jgi:hypothetical protein